MDTYSSLLTSSEHVADCTYITALMLTNFHALSIIFASPLLRPPVHDTHYFTARQIIMSEAQQQAQQVYTYGNPPPLGDHESGKAAGVAPPPPQDPPMRHYRPNSLGQPFNLVERFKSGRPSLGYGLFLGTPQLARIVGAAGYDWVMIDWEHTPMSARPLGFIIK